MRKFKYKFCFLIIILLTSNLHAQDCRLPLNQQIVIACTSYCDNWFQRSVKKAARRLNLNVTIKNIFDQTSSINWDSFDGVIIPGGEDIAPSYYIEGLPEDLQRHIRSLDSYVNYTWNGQKRDQFEYNLLSQYFADNSLEHTPILGVCRGMQMLTVSQGIPLYIDIKKELGFRNRRKTLDKISIKEPHSLIAKLIPNRRKSFRALENHHQGLRLDYYRKNRDQWPHLSVSATSNKDRIAEVLEFKNRPVLGVQFHPEKTLTKARRKIFEWLLEKACLSKTKKMKH